MLKDISAPDDIFHNFFNLKVNDSILYISINAYLEQNMLYFHYLQVKFIEIRN